MLYKHLSAKCILQASERSGLRGVYAAWMRLFSLSILVMNNFNKTEAYILLKLFQWSFAYFSFKHNVLR